MLFPRYGRQLPTDSLVARNQMKQAITKDQKPRLEGWMLQELMSPFEESARGAPDDDYMPGAPFSGKVRERAYSSSTLGSGG